MQFYACAPWPNDPWPWPTGLAHLASVRCNQPMNCSQVRHHGWSNNQKNKPRKYNKRCQFLKNSVIKPPFGIMSPDVTVIHPNTCTAHIAKYKYNMLQVKLSNFQTKAANVDVAPASRTSSFQALDLMSGFGCRNMQWNDHETTASSSLLPGWNRCEEMRTSRMVHKRYIWCNRVAASPCFSAFLL